MPDLEKVIKGLECFTNVYPSTTWGECKERNCSYLGKDCELAVMADALELLKAQEQEISRLKHHVDCDAAEKLSSGCVGYGRGFNDDEPCETCKACEKYNGYGEE